MKLEVPLHKVPVKNIKDMINYLLGESEQLSSGAPLFQLTYEVMYSRKLSTQDVGTNMKVALAILKSINAFLNTGFDQIEVTEVFDGEWIIENVTTDSKVAILMADRAPRTRFQTVNKSISQAIGYMTRNYNYPLPHWKKGQKLIIDIETL